MHQYQLTNKQTIPGFIVITVASWAIALASITVVLFALWIVSSWMDFDPVAALPKPLSLLLGLCGAYAALGAVCLWVTMWVYWIAVERSSPLVRIGWFVALILGLHYGALAYAAYVWRRKLQAISTSPSLGMGAAQRPNEKLDTATSEDQATLYLNRPGMLTLAKTLIKIAEGGYADGFHVHLRRDFNADLPERLTIVLSPDDAPSA